MPSSQRPSPDQLLRQVQAEEAHAHAGKLKIFLGYASGVGKSFRMLDEGRRRSQRGQDVVVVATQPQVPSEVEQVLGDLETIPPLIRDGVAMLDVETVLRRHPQVCLVDGLAYDNPPGSRHPHRWQDVEELLAAGISVLATINIQYIEELRERVARIRGKAVAYGVPEEFIRCADELVVVDAPPELCREESISPVDQLSQLRELALLLAADVVDHQLERHRERSGLTAATGLQERVLVCLTPRAKASRMIERAKLVRDRFHGELFAVSVKQAKLSARDQETLDAHLELARAAGAEVQVLEGEDPVDTIIRFAREQGITQLFIGHTLSGNWRSRLTRTPVDRLIQAAEGMDVKLFPH